DPPVEPEITGFELAGPHPVPPGEAWPYGAVDALRVEIPAGAATTRPDAFRELALDVGVELGLRVGTDLDGVGPVVLHVTYGLGDVADLLLDHEDHRVVPEPGVGAEEEEQVRVAGDRDAEVGLHALLGPLLAEVDAMRADDVEVVEGVGDAEAGPVDDGVHFAFRPGLVDDAGLGDLGDTVGDDFDVVARQRRIVVVGDQHTFAAHHIVGRELGPQHRVGDALLDMALRDLLREFHDARITVEADGPQLQRPVDQVPVDALSEWHTLEQTFGPLGHGTVRL